MASEWLYTSVPDLAMVFVSAVAIYVGVIAATRIAGLRSFAQFSSFDFAIAIAIGSVISMTVLSQDPPLLQGLVGLLTLYVLHIFAAKLRQATWIGHLVNNTPVVLVDRGELVEKNLKKTAVTEEDIRSSLRRENICSLDSVRLIVLETAGTISIIHSDDGKDLEIDPWLLEDVGSPAGPQD